MSQNQRMIFFVMPFNDELHYFYLYIKNHIETNHKLKCKRADEEYFTKPFLEKINDFIRKSDLIIADCTGDNPNVYYEIGLAHSQNKNVILLSQCYDHPANIQSFDFIHYQLKKHVDFLNKLDNAIENAFIDIYDSAYNNALILLDSLNTNKGLSIEAAEKERFLVKIRSSRNIGEMPRSDQNVQMKRFLLTKIIEDTSPHIMKEMVDWMMKEGQKIELNWKIEEV